MQIVGRVQATKRVHLQNSFVAQILNSIFGYISQTSAHSQCDLWASFHSAELQTSRDCISQTQTENLFLLIHWRRRQPYVACLFILRAAERYLFRTRHYFRLPIAVLNPISLIFHANLTAQPNKDTIEHTFNSYIVQPIAEEKPANIFFTSETPNFPFPLQFYCHFQPNKFYEDDASVERSSRDAFLEVI